MLALNSLKIFGNIKQRLDDENVGYTGFENVLSIANPSDADMKNLSSKLLQWKHCFTIYFPTSNNFYR